MYVCVYIAKLNVPLGLGRGCLSASYDLFKVIQMFLELEMNV